MLNAPSTRQPGIAVLVLALALSSPAASQERESEAGATRKEDRKAAEKARQEDRRAEEQARKTAKQQRKQEGAEHQARRRFESSGKTAVEWYADARRQYDAGRYLKAREILLPLEDSPRAIDIQEKVKLLIADTYFYQGGTLNLAEALARYRTFLTFHPNSEHAEYVQYQVATCYFKQLGPTDRDQSYTDNAIAEYERLLAQYPDGPHGADAKRQVLEAKARRAEHEYEVAMFYWEWRNYTAAADRFAELLRRRPELTRREEALYLAAESYYRSGRMAEGDAHAARLAADHPSSPWLARLSKGATAAEHARQAEKVATHRRKEVDKTHRRMLAREQARTRQIRKDSGLPGRLPTVLDDEGRPEPVAWTPSEERRTPKEAAAAAEQERRSGRLEREEQAQREKEQARQSQAEATGRETRRKAPAEEKNPRKAEERARKDAERAEKEGRKAEKLEAEEQAEKARRAERERAREEKRSRKAGGS